MTWTQAWSTTATWGRMVKLSHTVFALPFALSAAALAAVEHGLDGRRLIWIVVAMVAARNAGMGFNRLADAGFDAANPRTAGRELPAGRLSRRAVWGFTTALTALFVLATERLDLLWFAPLALAVVFGYSLTKRFTWGSHFVLGAALGLAPIGAWVAVAGTLDPLAVLLGLAVLAWVAGFDLIYACQDVDFDRGAGLHAFPARFGVRAALLTARLLHVLAAALLLVVGRQAGLFPWYAPGWLAVCAMLFLEHRLVRPGHLDRLNVAFFNVNAGVSVVYLAGVAVALLAGGG